MQSELRDVMRKKELKYKYGRTWRHINCDNCSYVGPLNICKNGGEFCTFCLLKLEEENPDFALGLEANYKYNPRDGVELGKVFN